MATVMTLRTISSVVAFLCLQGSMPIATLGSLERLGRVIRLLLPPFQHFLQLLLQSYLVCVEEVSSPSTIFCTGSRSARKVGCPQAKN